MTTQWCCILFLAVLFIFTGSVHADDAALQREIQLLKDRIDHLEQQLEQDKEGVGEEPNVKSGLLGKISIGGVLAGGYQYQDISDGGLEEEFDDKGRGALPFQPEISFTPTDRDEILVKLGFAAGNGINDETCFALAPWAADLEDDVKDINGRNRDYLLTAWYKHTFDLGEEQTVALTGGVIDATDYLDENTYANDEYTQFMNEALVNGPNAFLPSYDTGGAVEWVYHRFSFRGVYMNVGKNDEGNNFNFYGAQLAYRLGTPLGEGNYRATVNYCSDDFLDPSGTSTESRRCVLFSFDQELGGLLGAWVRFGTQADKAAVAFQDLLSGGIQISGDLWGRENDTVGIGCGYLDGGNLAIDHATLAEAYARFVMNGYFALTLDLQYEKDTYPSSAGEGPSGFTFGLRGVVEF